MDGILGRLVSRIRWPRLSKRPEPESQRDLESYVQDDISTKRDEFVTLLKNHDGRMKQSDIVSETEWSPATVSRVLSEMEADGIVHKISIGRANMVALVGAEPDWYTPPDALTKTSGHRQAGTASVDNGSAILLIEDNQQEAKLLKRAFKEANVTNPIHTVRDGVDAIDFLFQRGSYSNAPTPGLVLLDLGLMVVDGLDVLRELDEREAVHQFPIVVLSHSDDPTDIRRSYQAGAIGYLTKPDDLEELIDLATAIRSFWLSNNFRPPRPPHADSDIPR